MGRANRTAAEMLELAPQRSLRPLAVRDTATEIVAMSAHSWFRSLWPLATALAALLHDDFGVGGARHSDEHC